MKTQEKASHPKGEGGNNVTEHTPTPWIVTHQTGSDFSFDIVSPQEPRGIIVGSTGSCMDVNSRSGADAAFIVRAVNSHEALLEAAKRIIDSINEEQRNNGLVGYTEGFVIAFDDLQKAIAQAEGK